MLGTFQNPKRGVKIFMGVVLVILSAGMLLYLVPQPVGTSGGADAVAVINGQEITTALVQQEIDKQLRGQSVPAVLRPLYARQILDNMIFDRLLEDEADRLGLQVTPQEQREQIKQILPGAFTGDSFVGVEQYATDVEQRFNMSVPEFEDLVRKSLLSTKFQHLVTDGITVSPEEVLAEFRRQNEKVKIEFAQIKPADLAAAVPVSDADLSSFFEKNKLRYAVPERRVAQYALLSFDDLKQRAPVSDTELRDYYNSHIDEYKVQDRVHVEHILFRTMGKTDAEINEIKKKAADVLKQAKKGANFEDLAKKYSEDTTKDKGGDLGWIVRGQTVPEFEKVAFSLPKGAISDLVQTQFGFHIIKVLDKETAHTKSFDEVRGEILPILQQQKVDALSNDLSDKLAAAVRQSNRQPIDAIAKQFGLKVIETAPLAFADPVPGLGESPELHQILFHLQAGELSQPIRLDNGYVVLTVKDIQPAHQAALTEVRAQVETDYRQEKAVELARTRADELARRVRGGEDFSAAAKSLGLDAKTSDPFSRTGNIPDLGGAAQLSAAFSLPPGQVADPLQIGGNWVVYRVVEHQPFDSAEFVKQAPQLTQQVLQAKQSMAFDAFRDALRARMIAEGKLTINQENYKRLTAPVT